MASIRKKLEENVNNSKNTRMDIASGNMLGNWRPDEITHMTRYDKISSLCIGEANNLDRPLDVLEAGCGEIWVLRNLYKAYTVKKSDIIRSYRGVDIDPACLQEKQGYSSPTGLVEDSTWFANFNGKINIQDLTTNPVFDLPDNSIDFFWTTEVIEHMNREFIAPWLEDANRVLRPGGLIYVSTPNHDGSNDKLPEDHIYEWGFEELKEELSSRWELQSVVGTFCQMPKLRKAMQNDDQDKAWRWWPDQFELLQERYGKQFLRVVAATFYPEVSNNCAWILRKPA
tara:strand:+ start:2081 stop:2935 length:855 start_codon:yes stop_codon:yes gene_type:complete